MGTGATGPDTHGHFLAHDTKEVECARRARGVNVEAPEPNAYLHLAELVRDGVPGEPELDELVTPDPVLEVPSRIVR